MPDTRVDTIVRGGQVVTSSEVYDAAIAISGEKIVALGPEHLLPPADNYIDAEGKLVLPGLIDSHVGFREQKYSLPREAETLRPELDLLG